VYKPLSKSSAVWKQGKGKRHRGMSKMPSTITKEGKGEELCLKQAKGEGKRGNSTPPNSPPSPARWQGEEGCKGDGGGKRKRRV